MFVFLTNYATFKDKMERCKVDYIDVAMALEGLVRDKGPLPAWYVPLYANRQAFFKFIDFNEASDYIYYEYVDIYQC